MVSEATNMIFSGIIAGLLIAGTQPIINWLIDKMKKNDVLLRSLLTAILYLFWLLVLMGFAFLIFK